MLHQIIYSSHASVPPGQTTPAILEDCTRNNRRDGITGLLLCDGTRYLQALEGRETLVRRCYERIKADERHERIDLIRHGPVPVRQFGSWSMSFKQVSSNACSRAYLEELKSRLGEITDDGMLALFFGFAALSSLR